MMKEMVLIKRPDGSFVPASPVDREVAKNYRANEPILVTVKKFSARSLRHHRLYWVMLKFALQYFNPIDHGGLESCEKQTMKNIIHFVKNNGFDAEGLISVFRMYREHRKKIVDEMPEPPHKDVQALHYFIKDKLGMYTLVMTPEGLEKRYASISFKDMSQEDFNLFYKRAFSCLWAYLFNRGNRFKNEAEAERAILEFQRMGN